MRIAVAGASGTIGAPVREELAKRGHAVRALSRSSPEFPVDLETGVGLEAALADCDALIDATNGGPAEKAARAVLIDGGRRLLAAAAEAGIKHHVCISIVGIERVPLAYYRVKVEQEALVETSGLAYSIVRATQFHPLLDGLFGAAARYRVLPGGRARLQPVDPRQVAEVVAAVAEARPTGGRTTVAGPRVHELRELAADWKAVRARRALIVPAPLPPKLGRPLRDGALTDPRPDHRGTVEFAAWLAA
jgi:uncharacterized protein YbjT (DUF2867 family)